jgi:hypothetical protein
MENSYVNQKKISSPADTSGEKEIDGISNPDINSWAFPSSSTEACPVRFPKSSDFAVVSNQ